MEPRSAASTRSTPTTLSLNSLSSGSWCTSHSSHLSLRDNLTKDTSISPVDLETLIQTERVTKILDECIYKTKLAICLPNLVKEFHTLSSILSSENMDDLIFIFEQYDQPLFSESLFNLEALEEIKSGTSPKHRLNPDLGHLIYILNSYPALKPIVEDMVTKKKELSASLDYLLTLEKFRDQMIEQLSIMAAEEYAAKLRTKKYETLNTKVIANIKEKSEALVKEKEEFDARMESKRQLIESLKAELEGIRTDTSTGINKKILDSERQMVLVSRVHALKNDILQDEQAETTRVYNSMLATHVKDEKKLRARRLKVEMQLLSWIKKYDTEMADKQIELDDFQQKYEDEVHACQELEEKIKLQNEDYIPLMAEREEEYHREMTEKMEKFLREHAARVIQNAWRTVMATRAEKKKLYKVQKLQRKMWQSKNQEEKLKQKKKVKQQQKQLKKAAK